ncbi:hypothetical protein L596_010016 [Steinernema carpocapsae]|nr:hypothetical protein L596_010016 [Steinernema carpocapsae]
MITEKSTVVFECDVSGFPDPVVEFFLNGKKLSTGEEDVEITVTDGFYRIEIKNCMIATHDGEILARASNEHGQAESRARLTVEPEDEESRSAPTFIKDIEDQTVKSGEVATFETSVRGCPTPEVTWYLNGHQLNRDSPGVEIAVTNCDHKVTIDSATYAGTILCRAENTVGRYETKARLIVLSTEPKKKAPAFKQPLVNVSEIEESTAVFEVTVDAEPKATLKWTLNGEEIKESSRFQFREFDGSSKLEIHEIKLEESGTLRCTATNSEGEAISECQFTVTRKSCGPKFKEGPKTITIEQGSEAIFEAWADAMPPATYQWSIDGKKVWNSTKGTRVETIENRTKLIIDTTVHRESLTVSVIAENPHGMDESGARLIVEEKKVEDKKATQEETTTRTETTTSHVAEEGKTTVYQESITEHHEEHYVRSEPQIITTTTVSEEHVTTSSTTHGEISVEPIVVGGDVSLHETTKTEERVTVSGQPVLKIGLKDISVMQGEEAKFTTVIESVTEKVEWFLDDKKLEPTQTGVTMTQEASEYNLALDSKIHQSGTVSAKSGDTVTTAQFDVKEAKVEEVAQKAPETPVEKIAEQKEVPTEKAPEIHIPEFSERLTDIKVVEGEHFELRVTASDKPSFKWTLNGQPMHDGVEGVHIVDDGNKSTLSVDEAAQKHSGKVSVTAENEAGKAESSANITIELKATKPEIVSGPTDKTAQVGDRVEFVAKVRAQPETTVTWNVNGRTVDSTIHSGEDYKLIIESVEEFNSGTVTVTATNSAGSVDHKSQLKVEKPEVRPEFTKGSQEQEVNEGEPMKFEVTLNQAPSPDTKISWYINNTKLMPSDDVKIVDNGDGTIRVEIAKAKPEMTGVLKCKAENSKGSDETTAKVTVKPARAKPSFAKSPQDHTDVTTEEESVKFSAIVVGNPTPEVTWYLNNEKIVSSETIRVKYEETSGKTSIRIFGPNVEQSGTVKVVASNDVGSVEATANLKITKKTELPRFVTVMNDKQLNEGEIATFKATIAAFPEPEVVWSLNGEPLKPSENVIITNVGDQHNLELKNIVPEQTGEISCTATNAAGFKKQNASLVSEVQFKTAHELT